MLNLLAFWTQDEAQLDRLFRQSALYREDKWGAREDYRNLTIGKAISSLSETYTPPGHRKGREKERAVGWPDPEPLPDILPKVPVMPEEFLPETLRAYARDVADRMQIPLEFVGVPLVVALGFLVARKVAILPKRHDNWLVVPNLWGTTVARPGVLKSPAQEKAIDAVELLEIRARTLFKEQR